MKKQLIGLAVVIGALLSSAPAFSHFYSSDVQQLCKNAEESANMLDLTECAQAKLDADDKRLNENYKKAMAAAKDKQKLKASQRQWIKERDAECKLEEDSGQAGELNHVSCLQQKTSQKADDLADFALTGSYPRKVLEICLEATQSLAMPDLIGCTQGQLDVDDQRLNENYKKAMAAVKDKNALRAQQREWIKQRDKDCEPEADGGQNAMLEHVSCLRNWTIERSDQLAAMVKNR